MKRRLEDDTDLSSKRAYHAEVNGLSVADAAVATPLSAVVRSLDRHKVKHRPPLPATRRDLVFPANYTQTSHGRPFKLIDDGLDDKIAVFASDEQLKR